MKLAPALLGSLSLLCGLPVSAKLTPDQVLALPPPAKRAIVFHEDIQPILEASCIKCHGRGRTKGGFRLDTRETIVTGGDSGPAAVPGKSEASLLIELVSGLDPDNVMPKKGKRLTPAEVGLLRAWIDQDLPWHGDFTFARPAPLNLAPPQARPVLAPNEKGNPIDVILGRYFATNRFQPPSAVDGRLFARRVALDVLGLLPDADAVKKLVADPSPEQRAQYVRRLLADNRHYAENWLSFWNDLLRNDFRGTGYIDGGRKQITGWLYSALLTNLPYDQFVAQLIEPTPASEGFTKGIVWRGVVNASQSPSMQAAQNISQVFMGVNLKCASCHDSFINDWRLADAYGLASIYSDKPLELVLCDKPTGQMAETRFIYPELGTLDGKAEKPERLKRLAELITGPQDGRLPRTIVNRFWARLFGRGLVEPVDDMEQPAWNPELLDWLAADLVAHRYDLKHTLEVILTSRAYQLPAVNLGEATATKYVFRGPAVRRMSAEQFRDALGQLAAVWYQKSEFPGVTNQVRAALVAADPLAVALGRPNREQVVTVRASAATTLQALELTNGETLAKVLEHGAESLATSGPGTEQLIERLYRDAFERPPTTAERALAGSLVGEPAQRQGLEDLLWALVMLPEFQLIY